MEIHDVGSKGGRSKAQNEQDKVVTIRIEHTHIGKEASKRRLEGSREVRRVVEYGEVCDLETVENGL